MKTLQSKKYAIKGILVPLDVVGTRERLITHHYLNSQHSSGDYNIALFDTRDEAQRAIDTELTPKHHPSVMIFRVVRYKKADWTFSNYGIIPSRSYKQMTIGG